MKQSIIKLSNINNCVNYFLSLQSTKRLVDLQNIVMSVTTITTEKLCSTIIKHNNILIHFYKC